MLIKNLEKVSLLGSEWVLWLLLGLSAISIGIMLNRYFFFRSYKCDPDKLGDDLLGRIRKGDRRGALELLKTSRSIEAQVLLSAMEWFDGGAEAFNEAIEAAFNRKKRHLEGGLIFLGTVGNNAPFVGLLGTVIGVLNAFRGLASAGGGQNQSAMGNVMLLISEALIATGVGLLVALPAVVGFNVFSKKVGEVQGNVETIGKQLLTYLKAEPHMRGALESSDDSGELSGDVDDSIPPAPLRAAEAEFS